MEDFLIVGDPHAKPSNLDLIRKLQKLVEDQGKTTIWLGDMLDTKELIRGNCLNVWFDYFSKSKLTHHILVGNHDWFNLQCEDHSLQVLKSLRNVHVVDEWQYTAGGWGFLPYMHDQAKLKECIATMRENGVKLLFCHIDVSGFDYGNGHICKDGLTIEDLKGIPDVISGHFHTYQAKKNLTYLGTPFSHSFGEANQIKYLGIYRQGIGQLELVPTEFPRHIAIEFNCDEMSAECEHMFVNPSDPMWKEHKYRITLTGRKENIDRFPRYMYDEGGTEGKLNIKWVTRPTDFQVNEVSVDENTSNLVQFETWAGSTGMEPETIELGMEILKAVSE